METCDLLIIATVEQFFDDLTAKLIEFGLSDKAALEEIEGCLIARKELLNA